MRRQTFVMLSAVLGTVELVSPTARAQPALPPETAAIQIEKARIGCLDIQTEGNLTQLVGAVCNGRGHCAYKAPRPVEYQRAGVRAATRLFCTQAMEITYRCGASASHVITVRGDAWNQPPAELACDTIAGNRDDVEPRLYDTSKEPRKVSLGPPDYFPAPASMLDWSLHATYENPLIGFRIPAPPTPEHYNDPMGRGIAGAPGSKLGANEGRVRKELRDVARRHDAGYALCLAAQRFTSNRPGSGTEPSDAAWGTAYADLAVTGKRAFASFAALHPNEDTLRGVPGCKGASLEGMTRALDRAYQVATALRKPHSAKRRQALGWIAVSGEDDQPYRPVNVPSTDAQQFDLKIDMPKYGIVNTRYSIDSSDAPKLVQPDRLLVDGGSDQRRVLADPLPALAKDASVLLFVHGMDSRLEESADLAAALKKRKDRNWAVISVDLPTSGYADNIDHTRISPLSGIGCHSTPLLDFIESYLVRFVDTLDEELGHQLKGDQGHKRQLRAIVGGSLGGNMAMRLGRRTDLPWLGSVVAWSPAAVWPSYVARGGSDGCDTGWNLGHDLAVKQSLQWAGADPQFAVPNTAERPERRRELFYGAFDFAAVFGLGGPPQAQCWFSSQYANKQLMIAAARLDRQETYDAKFRVWHWRLGAEQLVFSQQQIGPEGKPLYLLNNKPMLLLSGDDDTCGDLGRWTRDVASKMTSTPGYARSLKGTGHSLDNEHPDYVAHEIAEFLR
jgi:pimeloyl-ACP methyl ester carboxylesterase